MTWTITGAAMRVHRELGPGFLESVYRNALSYELRSRVLGVAVEHSIRVHYRGVLVGNFVADILIDRRVIIEVKAIRALAQVHEVQLVNYLSATGLAVGILLNFGSERLEYKRKHRKQLISQPT